jgi:hypothetical protein
MVVHVGTEVVRDAAKLMERPLAVAFGNFISNEETGGRRKEREKRYPMPAIDNMCRIDYSKFLSLNFIALWPKLRHTHVTSLSSKFKACEHY